MTKFWLCSQTTALCNDYCHVVVVVLMWLLLCYVHGGLREQLRYKMGKCLVLLPNDLINHVDTLLQKLKSISNAHQRPSADKDFLQPQRGRLFERFIRA